MSQNAEDLRPALFADDRRRGDDQAPAPGTDDVRGIANDEDDAEFEDVEDLDEEDEDSEDI